MWHKTKRCIVIKSNTTSKMTNFLSFACSRFLLSESTHVCTRTHVYDPFQSIRANQLDWSPLASDSDTLIWNDRTEALAVAQQQPPEALVGNPQFGHAGSRTWPQNAGGAHPHQVLGVCAELPSARLPVRWQLVRLEKQLTQVHKSPAHLRLCW